VDRSPGTLADKAFGMERQTVADGVGRRETIADRLPFGLLHDQIGVGGAELRAGLDGPLPQPGVEAVAGFAEIVGDDAGDVPAVADMGQRDQRQTARPVEPVFDVAQIDVLGKESERP
jgi:hypothetical protein